MSCLLLWFVLLAWIEVVCCSENLLEWCRFNVNGVVIGDRNSIRLGLHGISYGGGDLLQPPLLMLPGRHYPHLPLHRHHILRLVAASVSTQHPPRSLIHLSLECLMKVSTSSRVVFIQGIGSVVQPSMAHFNVHNPIVSH